MALLLDTSVAGELLEDVQRMFERVAELDGQFLSVISRVELEAGVYRDGRLNDKRRARLDTFMAKVEELDFTGREVAAYSSIIAMKGFSRRLVADRMIAATAITHGLALATLNPRDFRDIPGLTIEDWSS
ncbi:MAG: PIN domain-containing protein [Sphingomicrobium sp.]